MGDNATSNFPTMGESLLSNVVNLSGQKVPYTTQETKQGFGKSGSNDPANKGNRGRSLIRNANGPRCYIAEKIVYPNEGAEAGKTYRSVKRVRGGSGFMGARASAGNTGGV